VPAQYAVTQLPTFAPATPQAQVSGANILPRNREHICLL
jgi:hypothetical protein